MKDAPMYVVILLLWASCATKGTTLTDTASVFPGSVESLSDNLSLRQNILKQFVEVMNSTISELGYQDYVEYGIMDGEANFIIYDLTDPTNHPLDDGHVDILNNHVYHFVTSKYTYAFSNIGYLVDGELVAFRAINCRDIGHSLADVENYLKDILASDPKKQEIMDRVRDYRDYARFYMTDAHSYPLCSEY